MINKIYLFDDDKENQQERYYDVRFVKDNSYSHILKYYDRQLKANGRNLDELVKDPPSVLLIHKSLLSVDDNDKFIAGTEKDSFQAVTNYFKDVPQVHFSRGDTNLAINKKGNITQLSKEVFYQNLETFLQSYEATSEIEIEILIYGDSYKAVKILPFYKNIFNKIAHQNLEDKLQVSNISPSDLKGFWQLKENKEILEIRRKIQSLDYTNQQFITLLNNIYNSTLNYGKDLTNTLR